MKKAIFLFLLFWVHNSEVFSQTKLSYYTGYGIFMQSSLTKFQDINIELSGLPAKAVERFPGYITHKVYLSISDKFGKQYTFYAGFQSTGGRISLIDYSGKWIYDMPLQGYQLGMRSEYNIKELKNLKLRMYFDYGATFSSLKLKNHLVVGEEKFDESMNFIGLSLNCQPGFLVKTDFKNFSIGLQTGMEVDLGMSFFEAGYFKNKLGFTRETIVRPEWTGLRTGILLSYSF